MLSKVRPRPTRRPNIETLESRQVMTVDPFAEMLGAAAVHHGSDDSIPDVVLHGELPVVELHDALPKFVHHVERGDDFFLDYLTGDAAKGGVEQHLDSAHGVSGLDDVRADYGFTGIGQTVAVIDSGIAFDHFALGGGFGPQYRVVGGWDFTENDANPYDDGPEGSHGTHVAGIIGSSGDSLGNNVGVAPGVDLVGLRVFNDSGNGSFTNISDALQWVIDNHDGFANPITAINLSLGTTWNATYAPSWASFLESKFQQIEALGIFISVSAGNDYGSYNTPGLSYPAASRYVVPVMSIDDSGSLSYYSQRHTNAIAAPGRSIRSTIPDYVGNRNGVDDDWANYSGTSMAAPYVAGASVLVRQAMDLVGYTNITQDVIYNHLRQTADTFFDSATSQNYLRLNLSSAMDALLPDDDYGSTTGTAHGLGTLSSDIQVSGMISSLGDVDYFTFTAGASGVATFAASESHQLDVAWDFGGASATQNGSNWELNVVAGQTYTVGLSTSGGLGYYDMEMSIESAFSYVDWSNLVGQQSHASVANTGEAWYRIVANQAGYVTAQASFANAAGNIDIALYDANLQLVDLSNGSGNGERVDHHAGAGEEFYLQVTGNNADIDFLITNMVAVSGTTVTVSGTNAADNFAFTAGASHSLTVNGVDYTFNSTAVNTAQFDGAGGSDSIILIGTSGAETATLRVGEASLVGTSFSATATDIEDVTVHSGGGSDTARLYDSALDDRLTAYADRVELVGTGFRHEVFAFSSTTTFTSEGNDEAVLHGTTGNDTFTTWTDRVILYGDGYWNDARGFNRTTAYASTGYDKAVMRDSQEDDTFSTWWNRAIMYGDNYWNDAREFNKVYGYASAGNDKAVMRDSNGDDTYSTWWNRALMYSDQHWTDARGFDQTFGWASNGNDRAVLRDSNGDDTFSTWSDRAVMSSNGYSNDARGFDEAYGWASGGHDVAIMYDSAGDDTFTTWWDQVVMYGDGYWNDARGFDSTRAIATGGNDRAVLRDSAAHDEVHASGSVAYITDGVAYRNECEGFEVVDVYDTDGDGTDEAFVGAVDSFFRLYGEWTEV